MGVSLFELDELARAEQHIRQTLNSGSEYIRAKSEWYIALIHVKREELEETEVMSEQIASTNGHLYQRDATQALSRIETLF